MLSRTADHLFWMARYTERAENTARMLDVNLQTSLLPQSDDDAERGWRAMLGISELQQAFDAKYSTLHAREVIDFMVRDPDNPSSIASCLTEAREHARGAWRADHRGVGDPEPDLARYAEAPQQRLAGKRSEPVFRVGQTPFAPVARRHAGHH